MPRFDQEWIEKLSGSDRERLSPPDSLLSLVRIAAGATVGDIGCGPGFLTLPAAERVGPKGTVWAIDQEPAMTRYVAAKARERGLGNVQVVETSATNLPLKDHSLDAAIVALLLHDLTPPVRILVLTEVRRVLHPNGRLLVIEWHVPGDDPSPHRLTPGVVVAEAAAAGFTAFAPTFFPGSPPPQSIEPTYAVIAEPRANA
ncbi:MAG: class I SAM-dependent methyltransferase [Chloroflexi bacterium]|nr:class I SAM-dependent methyltransferase [Chloroflexota bacterium]